MAEAETKSQTSTLLISGAIVAALVVVAFFWPRSLPVSQATYPAVAVAKPPPPPRFRVGQVVRLEWAGMSRLTLAESEAAWLAMLDAQNARDIRAINGMLLRDEIFAARPGDRARVIVYDPEGARAAVEITEGLWPGKRGIIQIDALHPF